MTDRAAPARRRRRRVSRRRYLVRRIGVLAVLALGVLGGVRLVGAVGGAGDGEASADAGAGGASGATGAASGDGAGGDGAGGDAAEAPATAAADRTEPEGGGPVATSAATVPATDEEPREPAVPSAASPATLLIAGDSDAGTFGPYLQQLLDPLGVVRTTLDYKVSSGLARPDFFDWPAHFRATLPELDPDIVVVTFGGNDAQGLATPAGDFPIGVASGEPGGDAEWREEYGRRVGEVMDLLATDGRTLVWVGIPNDDNPDVTARLAVQNEVVAAEAAERPEVVFVDTWRRFSGRDGGWAEYVIDPRDNVGKDVRAADGFHLNETGAEILALDIAEVVRRELLARGATV